ncbi:MAG: GNAT family N-acetyltransferase [Labilithrix sp.]|nr:GNAT family N-acetyltransferase [Labilithrix sp.]MCW5831090.1 GNAT family N-acetyltransferase [Labilithrix sp.]
MAAVTKAPSVVVRAAGVDEGHAIAGLWRELWDAHEAWGGYAGTRDPRVYEQLAQRLSDDARVRNGQPVLGRHVHLVAHTDLGVVGQVEGWFERHGVDATTPYTCEVRSLIVSTRTRSRGVGRALLDALAQVARHMSRGAPVVMAAEVLEPNPAHAFYAKVGYAPVSWTARLGTDGADDPGAGADRGPWSARLATPDDALAIAMLDPSLAARRRSQGDVRFDRPRAVDATFVGALAAHLARPAAALDQCELVVTDEQGVVRGSASLSVMSLDPPFVPARRGLLGRFAVDPALDPRPLVAPLVRLGRRLAFLRGAATLELTDLDPPAAPLNQGAVAAGARAWSRIVERYA